MQVRRLLILVDPYLLSDKLSALFLETTYPNIKLLSHRLLFGTRWEEWNSQQAQLE